MRHAIYRGAFLLSQGSDIWTVWFDAGTFIGRRVWSIDSRYKYRWRARLRAWYLRDGIIIHKTCVMKNGATPSGVLRWRPEDLVIHDE